MKFQVLRFVVIIFSIVMTAGIGVAADEVCADVPKESRVLRLDGGNAVIDGVLGSKAEVKAFAEEFGESLKAILEERGLAAATEGVLRALETGDATETTIHRGDVFEWMATRKKGAVTTFGPVCMASKTEYDAWRFEVTVDGPMEKTIHTFVIPEVCGNLALVGTRSVPKPPIPVPVVFLDVDRDCESRTITIDTGDSDPGAQLVIMTDEGIGHPIEAGTIDDPAPFSADLTFRIVASNTARDGHLQEAEKELTVPACPAPPPECSLSVPTTDVFVRQPVTVEASGHWVEDGFAYRVLDAADREVDRLVPGPEMPHTTTFAKPGVYRIQGGATNEIGETAGCEVKIFVRPRWNVRPKAVLISPTQRETDFSNGVGADWAQGFNSDIGGELDLEYHPTRLIGLEIGALAGGVDAHRKMTPVVPNAVTDVERDGLGVTMAHFALNFHFRGWSGVDFFMGPVVAWADVDDADFGLQGQWDGGSDTAFGAQLGLDIPLSRAGAWSLNAGIRYLEASFDDDPVTGEVTMNPVIANLGLSFGF